jgi:hypothetical protein
MDNIFKIEGGLPQRPHGVSGRGSRLLHQHEHSGICAGTFSLMRIAAKVQTLWSLVNP